MKNKSFENEVFPILSGTIICCNFTDCTFEDFDGEVVFEKCNLRNCKLNKPAKFVKSTIVNALSYDQENSPVLANAVCAEPLSLDAEETEDNIDFDLEVFNADKKSTDEAFANSTFEETNYADQPLTTLHFNPPTHSELQAKIDAEIALQQEIEAKYSALRTGKYFEKPNQARGYLLSGNIGLRRKNFDDLEEIYRNSLIESEMHTSVKIKGSVSPYISDALDFIKAEGLGKQISVDLTLLNNDEAKKLITEAGIILKKYIFNITDISYYDDNQKVLIAKLENPNETEQFNLVLDTRPGGLVALNLNKELSLNEDRHIRNIKPDGAVIVSLIEESEEINND